MKAVKVNMDLVNCVLLVVILAMVIFCLVKQTERFAEHGNNGNNHSINNLVEKKIQNAINKKMKELGVSNANANANGNGNSNGNANPTTSA